MDCWRLGLLHHVARPSHKKLLILEILFWLMLPAFWFWIIHQEEVPRNLDLNAGIWAAGLHTLASGSFWFPVCICRMCWIKHIGKSTGNMEVLGGKKPKPTQTQKTPLWTPQTAGLPWRLPLAKNLMVYKLLLSSFFRLPSTLAVVSWLSASYSVRL